MVRRRIERRNGEEGDRKRRESRNAEEEERQRAEIESMVKR